MTDNPTLQSEKLEPPDERVEQIRERQKRRSYALFQAGRSPMSDDDYADTEYLLSQLQLPQGDAEFTPPAEDALHVAICQAVQEHHEPTANAILRTALNDYKPTRLTRTELIRVQQRSGSGEVTAVMLSPGPSPVSSPVPAGDLHTIICPVIAQHCKDVQLPHGIVGLENDLIAALQPAATPTPVEQEPKARYESAHDACYVLTHPVHPDILVLWFLALKSHWFDDPNNMFYGMREKAKAYLYKWVETGELADDHTTLEITTAMKFREWLESLWTTATPSPSVAREAVMFTRSLDSIEHFTRALLKQGPDQTATAISLITDTILANVAALRSHCSPVPVAEGDEEPHPGYDCGGTCAVHRLSP